MPLHTLFQYYFMLDFDYAADAIYFILVANTRITVRQEVTAALIQALLPPPLRALACYDKKMMLPCCC